MWHLWTAYFIGIGFDVNIDKPQRIANWPLWRHQMETCSALLSLWAGNPSVTGGFPLQRGRKADLWCFLLLVWTRDIVGKRILPFVVSFCTECVNQWQEACNIWLVSDTFMTKWTTGRMFTCLNKILFLWNMCYRINPPSIVSDNNPQCTLIFLSSSSWRHVRLVIIVMGWNHRRDDEVT